MSPRRGSAPLDKQGLRGLLEFLQRGPGGGYEGARQRLLDFFRWRGVSDPEAYADRTLDRVAAKLADGEVPRTEVPLRYVLGVARYIHLEGVKAEARVRVLPPRTPEPEDDGSMQALEACLGELPEDERELVLRYHQSSGSLRIRDRKQLAQELGVSLSSLRMRMFRARQRLADCIRGRTDGETDLDPSPPRKT